MINAWSLAAEVFEDTLDETYPIIKKDTSRKSPIVDEGFKDDSNNQ